MDGQNKGNDFDELAGEFYKDCAQKKRISRGAYNRASRTGKIGKMLMPSDLMSKLEKRQLNGKVVTYNMYAINGITWETFKKLSKEEKYTTMSEWLKQYNTRKEIAEKLNVKVSTIQDMVWRLGLSNSKAKKSVQNTVVPTTENIYITSKNSFNLSLCGIYTGAELIERLEAFQLVLKPISNYGIYFNITEEEIDA